MYTYQDLVNASDVKGFVPEIVNHYRQSAIYREAVDGYAYASKRNTTILQYQKLLYTLSGKAVPDNFSANFKITSGFFPRFITQETQYLLGNGAQFTDDNTKQVLGGASFDTKLQEIAHDALWGGVSYGFFNLNHVENFNALQFAPLFDEEDGALKAGVRFWQIDKNKPKRYTLYELDGYTEYIQHKDAKVEELAEKRSYVLDVRTSEVDGAEIYNESNYPTFPIVPLWANKEHQSELVGLRSQIDAYDLIKSGFANDLDDASQIYWIIQNAGGMDDVDIAKFLQQLKTTHGAAVNDEASAEPHTVEVPYNARKELLATLRSDLYEDAMALDTKQLASGGSAVTASIIAAYEPLNNKCDRFQYCVDDFIKSLMVLIGIDDVAVFKRSHISNQMEETQMVLAAAQYLDDETVLKHLPFIDPDEVNAILDKKNAEEAGRYTGSDE